MGSYSWEKRATGLYRLTDEQRIELERRAEGSDDRARATAARIILLADRGWNDFQISEEVGAGVGVVKAWRRRFARLGIDGLTYPGIWKFMRDIR